MLQQRHAKVEAERDQLYSKFEASIYSVQQKTGVRNLLLEKKLSALGGVLEHKEAQLAEVMSASNLDPATLAHLNTVSCLLAFDLKVTQNYSQQAQHAQHVLHATACQLVGGMLVSILDPGILAQVYVDSAPSMFAFGLHA